MAEQGHILIADDEEIFLQTTAALLRREGYACTCVSNAAAVAELLPQAPFDLLIADIKMPGNPNLELIRDLPRLAQALPVILVTAYPSLDSAIQSIQLPVVAYLVKPVEFSELLSETRNALARSSSSQDIQVVQKQLQERHQDLDNLTQLETASRQYSSPGSMGELLTGILHNLANSVMDLRRFTSVLASHEVPSLSQNSSAGEHSADKRGQTPNPRDVLLSALQDLTLELQEAGVRPKVRGEELPPHLVATLQQLSPREREVLRLLLANRRSKSIARTLFISPYTVRNHLKSIFHKLGVHSQTELLERLEQYRLDNR